MLESFALNGRVGDIGIKDKTIEVKLVFPNDERTQDELAFLFPIKKGLATVRILAAVNKGYVPGRRRSDRDETGTPLLPGVDMSEICHACGRTVDCVNEPFFAKPVEGGKEIILCNACYMVPQPEEIEAPAAGSDAKAYFHGPCNACGTEYLLFSRDSGETIGSACPKCNPEEVARLQGVAAEGSSPEQLEKAADAILEKDAAEQQTCSTCGQPRGEVFVEEVNGKKMQRSWKAEAEGSEAGAQEVFERCPRCGVVNVFPGEGGEG